MTQKYYTIRIRIANIDNIHLDIFDTNNQLIREPSGGFGFKDNVRDRISELHEKARRNDLDGASVEELGKLLFSALFDEGLRREFLDIYQKAQQENALLRLELDVDERQLPEVAALPWEFMYVSPGELHGALWLATAPNIVFSRRRARWHVPEPIQLKIGERLRIAIAVAAPKDLGPVQYQKICNELKKMARTERFEVLEVVEAANRSSIDALLEKKPHIFHFIGHGSLKDENRQDTGLVALVDSFGSADLVSADYFSELFNRFRPGLVVLHACESGALSSSKAFVGIASRVVQMNVPAVAAMQFEVTNAAAHRFALEFYRRLAGNEPVDKAIQEARRHLALNPPGYAARDFATPVLFMSVKEGRLFQFQGDPEERIPDEELIKQLQVRLNDKCDELDDAVFKDVAKRLKQLLKKGIDGPGREYIDLLQEFFSNQITSTEFAERSGADKKPGAGEKIPDYDTLARLLKKGALIPFLGPGVLRLSGFPVPTSPEMVKKIAEKVQCPDLAVFKGTLPMISQYCRGEKKFTRGVIIDELRDLMHREKGAGQPVQPAPLYELLGEIEVPVLVVSTSYDNLLELTFCRKRKRFAVVSQYALHEPGTDIGKLQVQCSDKPLDVDKLYTPEEISRLRLFDEGYSIIYKIFGHFALDAGDKPEAYPPGILGKTSPLLFEEEFFTFSRFMEKSIPDHFIRKFSDSGFLFLGYDLHEWQDRMIAYVISKKWQNSNNSFSICKNPSSYERIFWKSLLSIDLYEAGLDEFIEQLSQRMRV
jgi:hypothetical protein